MVSSRKYISKLDRALQLVDEAKEHIVEAEDLTQEFIGELGDPSVISAFAKVMAGIHKAKKFLHQLKRRN